MRVTDTPDEQNERRRVNRAWPQVMVTACAVILWTETLLILFVVAHALLPPDAVANDPVPIMGVLDGMIMVVAPLGLMCLMLLSRKSWTRVWRQRRRVLRTLYGWMSPQRLVRRWSERWARRLVCGHRRCPKQADDERPPQRQPDGPTWAVERDMHRATHPGGTNAGPDQASSQPCGGTEGSFTDSASKPVTVMPCPPDPWEQAQQLIAGAWRLSSHRDLSIPTSPWELGLALHTGPVRDHNEDYVLALGVGHTTVAILTDGCGGILHGQDAAYGGARGAAASVIRQLAWLPGTLREPDLEAVALQAIHDASETLADQANRRGIDPDRAMRSTLIVTLVTQDELYYAHIGDGGGHILHTDDGSMDTFVEPQKVGSHLNLLSASLGATIHGEPRTGRIDRRRGDLIWICSDGVADRTEPRLFGCDLAQAAVATGGDMTSVARAFLAEFASIRDESGSIFDDNMSLILIGDDAIKGVAASGPSNEGATDDRQTIQLTSAV